MPPLADRLRPKTLDEVVGQRHLLAPDMLLRRVVETGQIPNLIFYGPSGVGKTTVASILAKQAGKTLHRLNGTNMSTADIKAIVGELDTFAGMGGVLLYLDEIQYLNKKQQQSLLEFIEDGRITLIASTTENPYFYIYNAILSRCTVFEFKSVPSAEIAKAVRRAFAVMEQDKGRTIRVPDEVVAQISTGCGGDVRKAINAVELLALAAREADGELTVTAEDAAAAAQKSAMKYDREGDEHYDLLSALQKSMRGSDPDAAVHYLARLLEAGDLPSVCRRLMVCACEDVGLAYPQIIPIVKASVDAALQVGLPEARIPLADAVVLVATSPKSNSAYLAVDAALADIRAGRSGSIPRNLQNKHYDGADNARKGQFYKYPHGFPGRWVAQQYLPDALEGREYYHFAENKTEQAAKTYWDAVKRKSEP
ncbi:replication-associated recombination protein A [Ethanoligenens harbinense]|uniref:AAA ATPase central domain protein n=1 Tax=Ethanoligenens harbinense (strain DSM 18485 / JCM 12961 / CGMCC 1.5033 / YUAN-3) TaxID=663278 RepID=E6U8P2_ETHHY|nr:AAA ATPase central domain protein [Ethanoligenens harbinense YUAN-3]